MNVEDLARVARLGLVMQLRDASFAPISAAAAVAGSSLLVGASAHGRRLEVVMDYHPDAHRALAPDTAVPTGTDHLRVRIDGEDVEVMFALGGPREPDAAVDELALDAVREPWLELVSQLCSIADAKISGRARSADGQRAMLQITYPARGRDMDAMLIEAISELSDGIGVSPAQRTLFRRIHPELGRGSEIVLTTRTTPTQVSAQLGISYPITEWATAVRLAGGLVFNDSEGKDVSRRLGEVAGAVAADKLAGLEIVLGPHEPPDVVVWARVSPR